MTSSVASPSVAPEEIKRFSQVADQWWQAKGAFRVLHALMPLRLAYVEQQMRAHGLSLDGAKVLDVGCGGGLMAESLAARGAQVTGIDASAAAIETAQNHAAQSGLSIDYRQQTAEELAAEAEQAGTYDLVLALEIIEHVADLPAFIAALGALVRPGGPVVLASLNKTKRSFLLGVVMAEYVLGWVPAGTHDWEKFVTPADLVALWRTQGAQPADLTGLVFKPLKGQFELCKGRTAVNYFMTVRKG